MKISNSKKELARIISENGGWRNGEFAAQDCYGGVGGYEVKPKWNSLAKYWWGEAWGEWFRADTIKNHAQTVLSRAEYFHLYLALGELCGKVTEENRHEPVWTNPPSIEQLAADYRNLLDFARRKQQEADDAKADADEKLRVLEIAGEALGLLVSPITTKQDQELAAAMAPPKAQNHIDDNSTEADLLRQALIDAATSLETIHVRSYGADSFLDSKEQMRSFAESRAKVAREALGFSVTPITTR